MSFDLARENIFKRFQANYEDTKFAVDNDNFAPNKNEPWVRVNIIESDSNLAGLGGSVRLFRNPGVISIQVFTPIGKGTKTANDIAESILTIFNGVTFDGITCRATSIDRVGEINGWYQLNVITPFYWDRLV